jgi:hypothetical protein
MTGWELLQRSDLFYKVRIDKPINLSIIFTSPKTIKRKGVNTPELLGCAYTYFRACTSTRTFNKNKGLSITLPLLKSLIPHNGQTKVYSSWNYMYELNMSLFLLRLYNPLLGLGRFSVSWFYTCTQTVPFVERVISLSQGRYLIQDNTNTE